MNGYRSLRRTIMNQAALGKRIKTAREKKNMTQEDLAAAVDYSVDHMSVIERGVKAPKLDKLVSIANVLDVGTDELLQDDLTSLQRYLPSGYLRGSVLLAYPTGLRYRKWQGHAGLQCFCRFCRSLLGGGKSGSGIALYSCHTLQSFVGPFFCFLQDYFTVHFCQHVIPR